MKKTQQGLSLIAMVFASILLIIVLVFALKIIPSIFEYRSGVKCLSETARDANAENLVDLKKIQGKFSRCAQVEGFDSVSEDVIKMKRTDGGLTLYLAYDKKIRLFANASLLLEFKSEASGKGRI